MERDKVTDVLCKSLRKMTNRNLIVPIHGLAWAFLPSETDRNGAFDKSLKKMRQELQQVIEESVIPRFLENQCKKADDPTRIVLRPIQMYRSERAWRHILWDSSREGRDFSEDELAPILLNQWEHSAGRGESMVLVEARRYDQLMEDSKDGHSELITAWEIACEVSQWKCALCTIAAGTWQSLDTSLEPFNRKVTAAAEYLRLNGKKVFVVVPLADHWDFKNPIPILIRLKTYLSELKEYFRHHDYDFEIHSPKIGNCLWKGLVNK